MLNNIRVALKRILRNFDICITDSENILHVHSVVNVNK